MPGSRFVAYEHRLESRASGSGCVALTFLGIADNRGMSTRQLSF